MRLTSLSLAALAFACLLAVGALDGCVHLDRVGDPPRSAAETPPLVLISVDGMRHDYLDRADADTPTLDRLVADGLRADALVPVFPTKTFPNHYSLVTGLHPQDHGIVDNTMRDPERLVDGEPARFSLSDRDAVTDSRWWGGEPVWVTAERAGIAVGTVSWPGSEAEIGGIRPTDWLAYDGAMPYAERVDTALGWIADGAGLVTLYFEGVDTAGHRHGPMADETARALEDVDAALGRLMDGLAARPANVVLVSDHGMADVSPERRVYLDDAIDLAEADEVRWGAFGGLWPADGADPAALVARIDALDHADAFLRQDAPAHLHYGDHARIPPIGIVLDEGWSLSSRAYAARNPDRPSGGAHGYDTTARSMHGVFVARGPAFHTGTTAEIAAVDVLNVLTGALGISAPPNAGDAAAAARVLR